MQISSLSCCQLGFLGSCTGVLCPLWTCALLTLATTQGVGEPFTEEATELQVTQQEQDKAGRLQGYRGPRLEQAERMLVVTWWAAGHNNPGVRPTALPADPVPTGCLLHHAPSLTSSSVSGEWAQHLPQSLACTEGDCLSGHPRTQWPAPSL